MTFPDAVLGIASISMTEWTLNSGLSSVFNAWFIVLWSWFASVAWLRTAKMIS